MTVSRPLRHPCRQAVGGGEKSGHRQFYNFTPGDRRTSVFTNLYFWNEISRIIGFRATRSIIGRDGWDILKDMDVELERNDAPRCRVADGTECTSLGSITVPLCLMGRIKLVTFLVVPEVTSSVILGMDFWRLMGIVPDLRKDVWNFFSHS